MIETFFMPMSGGYMGEIEYWLAPAQGYVLAGPPTVVSGTLLYTLVKKAA